MTKAQLKKERRRVLEETIAAIGENGRCSGADGQCKYIRVRGGKVLGCAVGRLIEDKQLCRKLDRLPDAGVSNEEAFSLLPENIQYLGQDFLVELQKLHDTSEYWDEENKLTKDGRWAVGRIKHSYL